MEVPAEVESLIADEPLSAHVATSVDDRPHVAPVWYGYRDGTVYFVTGGRKLVNIRRNPRVAVSVEDARGGDVRWNVTLLGTATVSDDQERIDWASGWIYDAYESEDSDDSETGDDAASTSTDGSVENTDEMGDEAAESDDDADKASDETDEPETSEMNDEMVVDGGYALVEVSVGSVSWQVYG